MTKRAHDSGLGLNTKALCFAPHAAVAAPDFIERSPVGNLMATTTWFKNGRAEADVEMFHDSMIVTLV